MLGARFLPLAVVLVASTAWSTSRGGQGRIALSGGLRWIPNSGFLEDARAAGEQVPNESSSFGPVALATFGYWFEDALEISLEGGYGHDSYSPNWRIDSGTLMAALRWTPWNDYDLWPYLGGGAGYSLNGVASPVPSYASWSASGYGGAVFVGSGWDLSEQFGVSLELRYTIASLEVPTFHSALNVGGLSLLLGFYLRLPQAHEGPELAAPQ